MIYDAEGYLSYEFTETFPPVVTAEIEGVFSHGTALYIHGMTDRTPIQYEMSFPRGYHFKKNEDNLKIRYLMKDVFEFGIENKKSPCHPS